jgi:hypothetical protein
MTDQSLIKLPSLCWAIQSHDHTKHWGIILTFAVWGCPTALLPDLVLSNLGTITKFNLVID